MSEAVVIEDVQPADEADWRRLWAGYNAFYEANVAPQTVSYTHLTLPTNREV